MERANVTLRTAIKPTHIAVSTPTSANSAGEYRWNPAAVESLFALSNALLGISSSAEFFSHCDSGFATEDGSSSRCSSSHSTTARQPNNDNNNDSNSNSSNNNNNNKNSSSRTTTTTTTATATAATT